MVGIHALGGRLRLLHLFLPRVIGDIHNLVLKNEEVRAILARYANHILVVVLDPTPDNFAIRQFQTDNLLLFAQRLQISRFLEGFIRRWRSFFEIGIRWRRHASILHA